MEIYCTRPTCSRPQNFFADLDDKATLQTAQQKYCTACGMPLILVGRYLPTKLLGQGGFGTAFLARDRYTPTMRDCVVKQFQPSGDLSPQQLAIAQGLFEREAEVLEQLGNDHPQIPNLYAFFPLSVSNLHQSGKEDQFFYLVQEFIDGQDLEEELQTKGTFSEAEVLEVLRAMLKVLQFVHDNGSIHRDIKPSNIMRHQNGRLYLLDFGAVKQVTKGAAGTPSGKSTGIYSMGFAPPEQMSGAQVYPSTDLYALAVTLIMLLTGKEPEELYDSYNNSWNWRPYTQVSDTLAEVLNRMLLPTPNKRFQSAQEVMDALKPRRTPPAPPPPPPPTPKPQPAVQQQPVVQPQPVVQQQPAIQRPKSRFTLSETLISAGFTGFEGALLFIALKSFLGISGISVGLVGMIVGGLIYTQYRRIIEGKDLLILAGITLVLLFIPALRVGLSIPGVILTGAFVAAGAIAITALFRLIYLLLSRFL
ncbi:protein kinase domain-containing protein [Coleofasciculus sp. E1-EBD-02]|uniref:protein kinase domain-containing protein n=1 Tax=Coleofasciculus sp. E1-EBD-02 TaxID=3068481 RepID=UPI0033036102